MYFLSLVVIGVLSCGLGVVVSTCASDKDEKVCVAPDVLRTLMKTNHNDKDGKAKPAFFAKLKVNHFTLVGVDDVLKFEDVKINRGGGYDPSTGYFTAPRTGLYQISCSLTGYPGQNIHYQMNKNDSLYILGYVVKENYQSQTMSALVNMKKGDRVFIKHRISKTEKVYGSHHSTFSGYFLQE